MIGGNSTKGIDDSIIADVGINEGLSCEGLFEPVEGGNWKAFDFSFVAGGLTIRERLFVPRRGTKPQGMEDSEYESKFTKRVMKYDENLRAFFDIFAPKGSKELAKMINELPTYKNIDDYLDNINDTVSKMKSLLPDDYLSRKYDVILKKDDKYFKLANTYDVNFPVKLSDDETRKLTLPQKFIDNYMTVNSTEESSSAANTAATSVDWD